MPDPPYLVYIPGMHPSEQEEQIILATWLDWVGVTWFHPPNEGRRSWRTGALLKRCGMKSGVPDCIIITRPPNRPGKLGVAIELKRVTGGQLTRNQGLWLDRLREENWIAEVCHGADKAIELLQELGYDSGAARPTTERKFDVIPGGRARGGYSPTGTSGT